MSEEPKRPDLDAIGARVRAFKEAEAALMARGAPVEGAPEISEYRHTRLALKMAATKDIPALLAYARALEAGIVDTQQRMKEWKADLAQISARVTALEAERDALKARVSGAEYFLGVIASGAPRRSENGWKYLWCPFCNHEWREHDEDEHHADDCPVTRARAWLAKGDG